MNQKPHPVARLLPSLTDFAFLMPAVFLFARMDGAKTMLGDGDTGWHVRTGEWILAHRAVPHQDFFSYTMAGRPWYAWEWLWDLCFGWLHLHWGLAGVVAASVAILCFMSGLLFRLVLRGCDNRLIAFAATFVAVSASAMHWLARPHLVTMLFLVIWLSMLARVEDSRTRLLWWMPPLTILWTNLHGGFFVGIMILCMYAAGAIADKLFAVTPEAGAASLAAAKRYGWTALGCLAASFVNPYTYQLHAHIIAYFRDSYHIENINEFQSPSFHPASAVYTEALIALGLLACFWNLSKRKFTPLILLAAWAHMSLVAARNIPLFALIAAPLIASSLWEMIRAIRPGSLPAWFTARLSRIEAASSEFGAIDRLPRVYAVSVVALAAILGGLFTGSVSSNWRAEYDAKRYPEAALKVLKPGVESKRIFTDDEWGDYLVYSLYPLGGKVFVDGRSDFYGGDFGRKYIDLMNVNYKWQSMLDGYGVDTVLLSPKMALAGALKESRRWRIDYDDGIAIVFTAVKAANEFSTGGGKECSADCSSKAVRDRKSVG